MFSIRNISILSSHKYINKLAPHSPYLHAFSDEELRRLQLNILNIYLDIQSFCDKHHLCVMLAYGSALGAVRHKGFIPWDDDIDVLMPREDYEFLIQHFEEEYGSKYWAVSPLNTDRCTCYFGKIISKQTVYKGIGASDDGLNGTFVDIFPIENFPLKTIKLRKMIDLGLKFVGSCLLSYKDHSLHYKEMMKQDKEAYLSYKIRRFIGFFFSFISYRKWALLYDKFVHCPVKTGKYHDPTGDYRWLGYEESILFPPKKTVFEGHLVYVPNQVDNYLVSEFGSDYMVLPPENKRIRHYAEEFKEP